jgi:hypothetical protein
MRNKDKYLRLLSSTARSTSHSGPHTCPLINIFFEPWSSVEAVTIPIVWDAKVCISGGGGLVGVQQQVRTLTDLADRNTRHTRLRHCPLRPTRHTTTTSGMLHLCMQRSPTVAVCITRHNRGPVASAGRQVEAKVTSDKHDRPEFAAGSSKSS